MIRNLFDLFSLSSSYHSYLFSRSINFDARGFPVFQSLMFLKDWPEVVIPYAHRHNKIVKNPQRTVLCLFGADQLIYPRLENVLSEIEEYKKYQGVIMSDLTVTSDMDPEWQDFLMLFNQLYMAILAVNGIRVVLNTRCTDSSHFCNFKSIPKHVMCAAGFLGCKKSMEGDYDFTSKILMLRPSKLIIYGKHDYEAEKQLNTVGINFRVYPDYHSYTKRLTNGGL